MENARPLGVFHSDYRFLNKMYVFMRHNIEQPSLTRKRLWEKSRHQYFYIEYENICIQRKVPLLKDAYAIIRKIFLTKKGQALKMKKKL